MKVFDPNLPFYKGNLHAHTTRSDGDLTPEECIQGFKDHGYDFLAITDHRKPFGGYQDDQILVIPAAEYDVNYLSGGPERCFHITGIGLVHDFDQTLMTPQQIVDAIKKQGAFCTLCHPIWSMNTLEDLMTLDGYDAIEIFNTISEVYSGRGYSGQYIDLLASRGIYKLITAVDDCEFFITYLNSNTEKPLSNYPDIKVHIVGGTCNGTFDIVRGHTNSDWTWLSQNMMKHTYLHVRTENHTFCGYLSELKTMTSQLVESLQMLDWGFQSQERTMSRHYGKGYYRPVVIVTDHGWGINPNAGNGRISWPGINKGYLLNTSSILNADWWPCWAFPHEHGHMRQKPLWMAGMREISNEALVQIYTHEWGRKTAKGSQTKLANHFNEGRSWVDIFKGDALLPTMAWYQLWLYFRQMGDTEFFARWIECIKNRGLFQSRFTSWENPARIDKDYMLMALAACEAAQTDLYEYFKTWGFFNYAEQVNGTNDNGVVHVADYESYYLKVPRSSVASEVKLMEQWKKEMQAYEKKAPGAMFINSSSRSRNIDANDGCAKFDRSLIGQAVGFFENDADRGCTGYFLDYGKTNIGNVTFRQNNLSITVTGTGVVGIKIYDDKGELIRISYFKTFSVPKAVADGIADGTYSLVASLTDCTDLLLSGPPTAYTTERQTGIAHTSLNKEESNAWYTLGGLRLSQPPTQKGVYINSGKKRVVTKNQSSASYFHQAVYCHNVG